MGDQSPCQPHRSYSLLGLPKIFRAQFTVLKQLCIFLRVEKHFTGLDTKKSVKEMPINWTCSDFTMKLKLDQQCLIFA